MKQMVLCGLIFVSTLLSACAPSVTATTEAPAVANPTVIPTATEISSFQLTSDAFANNESIPEVYSCDGKNISPALTWNEPPTGTQSFALIMDDPDAPGGTWVHWVLFNIPASARSLPEAFSPVAILPDGSTSGISSFGRMGYGGPCPPSGTHHYFFKLYALDEKLSISVGADKGELEKAMTGHILAQSELVGTYGK